MLLNTERCRELVPCRAGQNSFAVFLCVDGCGLASWGEEALPFFRGDCIFVPADSAECRFHGTAQFLKVSC